MNIESIAVGDWINCEYEGRIRVGCEVLEVNEKSNVIRVRYADGFRCFKLPKIRNLEYIKFAE